jgi:hypothetical protein
VRSVLGVEIFWPQISTSPTHETKRPGMGAKIAEYNQILAEVYGDNVVSCATWSTRTATTSIKPI